MTRCASAARLLSRLLSVADPDGRPAGDTKTARPAFPLARPFRSVSTQSAPEGIRTPNLLIRSQMLYPLSYGCPPIGADRHSVGRKVTLAPPVAASTKSAAGIRRRSRTPRGRPRHRRTSPPSARAPDGTRGKLRSGTASSARNRQPVVEFLATSDRCEPFHRSERPCGRWRLRAGRTLNTSRHLLSMWTPRAHRVEPSARRAATPARRGAGRHRARRDGPRVDHH